MRFVCWLWDANFACWLWGHDVPYRFVRDRCARCSRKRPEHQCGIYW